MDKEEILAWLQKCLTCKYVFQYQKDELEYHCKSPSGKCTYKEYKSKGE